MYFLVKALAINYNWVEAPPRSGNKDKVSSRSGIGRRKGRNGEQDKQGSDNLSGINPKAEWKEGLGNKEWVPTSKRNLDNAAVDLTALITWALDTACPKTGIRQQAVKGWYTPELKEMRRKIWNLPEGSAERNPMRADYRKVIKKVVMADVREWGSKLEGPKEINRAIKALSGGNSG